MGATTALVTFQEFERLPDGPEQRELLQGELIQLPPPERRHMEIAQILFRILSAAVEQIRADGFPVGEACIEMGYLMSGQRSWLRPDVSVTHIDQCGERFYEDSPALVIEIVSQNDTAKHLEGKVQEYLAHGAREVWVVYPDSRHVRVYDASGASRLEEHTLITPLLPSLEIPLHRFL